MYEIPGRKLESLLYVLPNETKNLQRVSSETFKRRLDKWLRTVPDIPKIDIYAMHMITENDSIVELEACVMNTAH